VVAPAWLNEATTLAMTLVVLGVALLIDPARLGDALTRALDVIQEGAAMATVDAPAPLVIVALALVVASVVLSDWLDVPD
jgi:ribose/xylose/arabinose/galactoside ABC-type transport system permease subunit